MKKTEKPIKKSAAKTAKPAKKTAVRTVKAPPAAKTGINKSAVKSAAPGFTSKELEEIKLKLDEMRLGLSKNVEDKKNLDMLEPEVGDSIDQATQSLDKEILFELSDNERKMLRDIEAALRKMEKGTYGLCEHCKKVIEKRRIKALPSARYCMICQSGSEKSRV